MLNKDHFGYNMAGGEFGGVPGPLNGWPKIARDVSDGKGLRNINGYTYNSLDYWKKAIDDGATILRFPVRIERIFDYKDLEAIGERIQLCRKNRVKVIVDLHNYNKVSSKVGLDRINILKNQHAIDLTMAAIRLLDGLDPTFITMNEPINDNPFDNAKLQRKFASAMESPVRWMYSGVGYSSAHQWYDNRNNEALTVGGFKVVDAHAYPTPNNNDSDSDKPLSPKQFKARLDVVTNWARLNGFRVFFGEIGVREVDTELFEFVKDYVASNDEVLGVTFWARGEWWPTYHLNADWMKFD